MTDMIVEKRKYKRTPRAVWMLLSIALAAAVLAIAPLARAQSGPSSNSNPVAFQDSAVTGSFTDQHAVIRSRSVALDPEALAKLKPGQSLTLNFFSDATLHADIEQSRHSGLYTTHLQGTIQNHPNSSVLMVIHDGAVAGIVRTTDSGTYRIRSAPGRGQIVEQIDDFKFPPCGTGPDQHVHALPDAEPQLNQNDGSVGCPIFVDIMIVYTPEARDLEGGTAQIQAIAILAIDATNAAYGNSQIDHFVRLVYLGEVDYAETGFFGIELGRLRDPADGFMDEVHPLRDQYGADLVDLLISHTEGGTICGIAYLMTNVSPGFAADGFSVCNTGCVSGGFVFEHEIGHNMGCHHDRATVMAGGGGQGAFDFSYGHRFTGNNFVEYRTIMSYAPGERIPYFSNPNIVYQGQPTGVVQGSTDPKGNPNSADNALTHNLTAGTVASFRPAAAGSPGSPHTWSAPDYIQPIDLLTGDQFGVSVALHGELMIVGAYTADVLAADSGAAYIFRFNATTQTWTEEAKIYAFDGLFNDRFGIAVDIYDDGAGGGLALVGAYQSNDAGRDSGSAYVFRSAGGGWGHEAKLLASDTAPGDLFGRSVSLAVGGPNDEYAIIGSPLDDDDGTNRGSAYVFRRDASGLWAQVAKLHGDDSLPQDQFGFAVDLAIEPESNDIYALAGAWRDDEGAFDAGAAFIFKTQLDKGGQTEWVQIAKLLPPDPQFSDQFGYSVDLDITAETRAAIISMWQYDGVGTNSGAAYVFRDNGVKWALDSRLTPLDAASGDRFGSDVAISGDAALVGAYLHDDLDLMNNGAAYLFRKNGLNWIQEAKIVAKDAADEDQFGFSVDLLGSRAAIGAWMKDFDKTTFLYGAVYVTEGVPIVDCNKNSVPDECDIASGASADANGNGIPDECEIPPCPADVNGDGAVNVIDLLAVINGWGPCPAPPNPCPADIAPIGTPDGMVNVIDLLAVINNWGPCPMVP